MATWMDPFPDGPRWPQQDPLASRLSPDARRLDLDADLTRALGSLVLARFPWPPDPLADEPPCAVLDLPAAAGHRAVLLARSSLLAPYRGQTPAPAVTTPPPPAVVCADPDPDLLRLAADVAWLAGCPSVSTRLLDALAGPLPFPSHHFHLVHLRLLHGLLPEAPWPSLLAEAVRVLAPGGWLLLEVSDRPLSSGPATLRLLDQLAPASSATVQERPLPPSAAADRSCWPAMLAWVRAVARRRGLTLEAPLQIPTWLAGPGLHPQVRPFAAPLNGQAQGGALFARDLLASLLALAPALATVNEVPLEQVQEVLIQLPEAWARCGTRCGGLAVWAQVRERAV